MNSSIKKAKSRRKKRDLIADVKTSIGCTDCGYDTHPDALQFDHLPKYDKSFNVSRMISWDLDIGLILEEIAKTEVVCANCHAVRTATRREGGSLDQD